MKEYVHHSIIFTIHHIVMHKLQELSHLVFGNCFSCDCIIYQYSGELVVNSQGRTAPEWPEQSILLENEGVAFRSNGHVDMRRSRWNPETE